MVQSCRGFGRDGNWTRVCGVRAIVGAAGLGVLGGLLGGCATPDLGLQPGSNSVFSAFSGPTPTEAAALALDKYNANNRYRGTLLLSSATFAGEPVYMALFRDNMDDEDPGVRAVSARAVARHGTPDDATLLIQGLADPDANVRIEVARGLQRIHNPAAVVPLLKALNATTEAEPQVRFEAASALGQYPQTIVVEELVASLEDPNLSVNRNTLMSLRTLTGQDFGFEQKAWLEWYNATDTPFAARNGYMYPAFSREKKWWEHIPFVPQPPNEPASVPAGMPTTAGGAQ